MPRASLSCRRCGQDFETPKNLRHWEDRPYSTVPYLPLCLHTVCESCLHDASERSRGWTCDLCDMRTPLPHAVGDLCIDWGVVTELRKQQEKYHCFECAENTEATFWCETCGVGLCEGHRRSHLRTRKTAMHRLTELTEEKVPPLVIGCPKHEGEAIAFCCLRCGRLGCPECVAMDDDHRCLSRRDEEKSAWIPIEEAPDFNPAHDDVVATLRDCLERTELLGDDLETAVAAARAKVAKTMDDVRRELNRREAELLGQIDACAAGACNRIDQRRETIKRYMEGVQLTTTVAQRPLATDLDPAASKAAQRFAINTAVDKRFAQLKDLIDVEPLAPPPIHAEDLAFHVVKDDKDRLACLVRSLGRVQGPDDIDYEPRPPPPVADSSHVQLLVNSVQNEKNGAWVVDLRQKIPPDDDDDTTEDHKKQDLVGDVLARVVCVTAIDPQLKAVINDHQLVETLGEHPPTVRLQRRLSLRGQHKAHPDLV